MTELDLWISCAPGLEGLLAEEIRTTLGVSPTDAEAPSVGGVALRGDARLVARANLQLGLAAHVLVRVGRLRARGFAELSRKAAQIEWARWLDPVVPREILATSRRSRLYHTEGIGQRIAATIDDALGPSPTGDAPVTVVARMLRDECTLSIDTSGAPLHRRGWRQQTAKAPLREDLARALLLASGWDPTTPLCDPMMGAGTLVIEAATMARRLAPGRLRSFALERTPLAAAADLPARLAELEAAALAEAPAPIVGRDRDRGALAATEGNATRAGVRDDLTLSVADVRTEPLPALGPVGTVVTNPPYGRRVDPKGSLTDLHETLGERVRALGPGWRAALVTPHRAHAERTGLPLAPRATTDHGGIRVQLWVGDGA